MQTPYVSNRPLEVAHVLRNISTHGLNAQNEPKLGFYVGNYLHVVNNEVYQAHLGLHSQI